MNTQVSDEATLLESLPALHDLQQVDRRLGELLDLRAELDDGSGKATELKQVEARLQQIDHQLAELRSRQSDRRVERDTLSTRREKNQHRLWQENPTQQEAEALQHDLQATATRLEQIERELLDLENRIEPLEHQEEDEGRTLSELQGEIEEVKAKFAEDVKDIDAELLALAGARAEQGRIVAPELLSRYELIRQRRGDPGVVKVENDAVCAACHTQLTSYKIRQLQMAQAIQHCENCNTILYWTGEASLATSLDDWRDHPDVQEMFEDDE